MPSVLVTGGAGYIGSHTCVVLLEAGYEVVVLDSLVNSSEESIARVRRICPRGVIKLVVCDLCDVPKLNEAVAAHGPFTTCIHFAALKAVGESVQQPVRYYANNITGTLNLIRALDAHGCRSIVFSSSATVYGSAPVPYTESSQTGVGVTAPYGQTKVMVEQILRDLTVDEARPSTGAGWKVVLLRYFNPVGSHESGLLGDDPNGIPNNLMPYISQVAAGRRPFLTVFGKDYPTADGTCERDYIHVVDLARGHLAALRRVERCTKEESLCKAYNLGSGKPTSVLEMVKAMERAVGRPIPHKMGPRRPGDLPAYHADPRLAKEELGWETKLDIDAMCRDTWRWQQMNPNGFRGASAKL